MFCNLTNANPAKAARCFNERIENASMTIRCQQLQCLQNNCTSNHDHNDKKCTPRIRQCER